MSGRVVQREVLAGHGSAISVAGLIIYHAAAGALALAAAYWIEHDPVIIRYQRILDEKRTG